MRAAVLHNSGINVEEAPVPELEKDTVLIRVHYCGICGSDIPRVNNGSAHHYPIILGHEFSGTISDKGDGVQSVTIGDHVVGIPLMPCNECSDCRKGNYSLCKKYSFVGSRVNGGFAEYVEVPKQNVIKIPNSINMVDASTIEPCTVARHAFSMVDVENKKVAIIGSGIIGLYATQWARIKKAKEIVLVTHGNKGIDATEVGANIVVPDTISGDSYDVIVDCAGTGNSFEYCLKHANNKGIVVLVGTSASNIQIDNKTWGQIQRKELEVRGSWMSYSSPFPGVEWSDTINEMAAGNVRVNRYMVSKVVKLSEIKTVFETIDDLKKNGRVIIDMGIN